MFRVLGIEHEYSLSRTWLDILLPQNHGTCYFPLNQPITEPVLLDKSSWESIFDATRFSTDDKWFGFLVILLPWWWNMIFHLAIYLYNLMVKRITANWNTSQGIGESFPYWCLSCLQAGKTKINFVNRNLALSTNQLFIKTDISVDVWIPEPPGMSKTQWWILCLRKYHT